MNRSYAKIGAAIVVIVVISVVSYAALRGHESSPLIVYSADSYVQEASVLVSGFHNSTGYSVAPVKGGGSLTDARNIGQGSPSDAFISVSLESYGKSFLQSRYSGWAVAFAADQMVLAYSSASLQNHAASKVINEFSNATKSNSSSAYNGAFTDLTSGSVKVGIADPNSDPAGYRGWLVLEIAGSVYQNNSTYYVNRLILNGGNITASDAASLVSPLENGNIQFLLIYKSAAISKAPGVKYISLPGKVNLGDVSYANFYSNYSYNLSSGTVTAAPIYLYISALNNSGPASIKFVLYVLNNTAALSKFGLDPLSPELLYSDNAVPQQIQGLVGSGNLTRAGKI